MSERPPEPGDLPEVDDQRTGADAVRAWAPHPDAASHAAPSGPAAAPGTPAPQGSSPGAPPAPTAQTPYGSGTPTVSGTTSAPGVRLRGWHVAVGLLVLLAPFVFWFANGLGTDEPEPDPAAVQVGPSRTPVATPRRTARTLVPPTVRSPAVPSRTYTATRTPRASLVPPRLLPGPSDRVAPLPGAPTTLRFEVLASPGATVEVRLNDATHLPYVFPERAAPFAFELPLAAPTGSLGSASASNGYYSVSARIVPPDGANATASDVQCRIIAGGVVLMTRQAPGYVTCSMGGYELQRRR